MVRGESRPVTPVSGSKGGHGKGCAASRTVEVIHLEIQVGRDDFRRHIGINIDPDNLNRGGVSCGQDRNSLPSPGPRTLGKYSAPFGRKLEPPGSTKELASVKATIVTRLSCGMGAFNGERGMGRTSRTSQVGYCSATSMAHDAEPKPHSSTLLSCGIGGKINLPSNILLNTLCMMRRRSASS